MSLFIEILAYALVLGHALLSLLVIGFWAHLRWTRGGQGRRTQPEGRLGGIELRDRRASRVDLCRLS